MARSKKKTIGIIGVGMVGGALRRYFRTSGYRVSIYDNHKELGSPEGVDGADVVFICVPTPHLRKTGCDTEAVEQSIALLASPKIVVIRSTVIPGTTERLQRTYRRHRILFIPEFLTEATADRDTRHPKRLIVGWTEKSRTAVPRVTRILPKAPFTKIIPSREAEFVKYFSNMFYAAKVVFANQFYDLMERVGADYELVQECAMHDPMIAPSHLRIWHKGYRGYGGRCLPKDVDSFIRFGAEHGERMALLRTISSINRSLRKKERRRWKGRGK